jgi:hypothetical protein
MDQQMFSRRDVDMLKMQRELLRRASMEAPAAGLGGEDQMLLRQFAQETIMLMKSLYPEQFKDRTVEQWWEALKHYVASRRPEFRKELIDKLKLRYADHPPKGKPSELLASQAAEGLAKKAESKKNAPSLLKGMLRGAGVISLISALARSPAYAAGYAKLRKAGVPHGMLMRLMARNLARGSVVPAVMGAAGGAVAHPFVHADWQKREERKKK